MTVSRGDGRSQYRTIPPGSSWPVGRLLARLRKSLANTERRELTNSLVGGGHEGGSGSNEEGEEEEGTHLVSVG